MVNVKLSRPRIWLRIRSEGVHRVERWPLGGAGGEASLSKCWDYLVDHTKELEVSAVLIRSCQLSWMNMCWKWSFILFQKDPENIKILENEYNELGNILSKVDMPALETFINIYSKILVNSFSLRSDRYNINIIRLFERTLTLRPTARSRCKSNEMHSLGVTLFDCVHHLRYPTCIFESMSHSQRKKEEKS